MNTNNDEVLHNSHQATLYDKHRKEKTRSIFTFLQKFKAKNKNIFTNVTSLPSSPKSIRSNRNCQTRWESVESVLSSATTNSFAFIQTSPRNLKLIQQQKFISKQNIPTVNLSKRLEQSIASPAENVVLLRRKYNLPGSDVSLYPKRENKLNCNTLKKWYRKSVGDVDWLSLSKSQERESIPYRPNSECCISEVNKVRKCYRPNKGRAPPPPILIISQLEEEPIKSDVTGITLHRKKRRAPLPPDRVKMDHESQANENQNNMKKTETVKEHEIKEDTMYNDSLKLEKGQLKPNNISALTTCPSSSSIVSDKNNCTVPVSPRPWYKRNSRKTSKKTSSKKLDKLKTHQETVDKWMSEAGLSRSFLISKSLGIRGNDIENKRRSQISMLANISQLDREAAEIVQQERKRKQEIASSQDNKYYNVSTITQIEKTASDGNKNTNLSSSSISKEMLSTAAGCRIHSKNLLSILNTITNNTTKMIEVNANSGNTDDCGKNICDNQYSTNILDTQILPSVVTPNKEIEFKMIEEKINSQTITDQMKVTTRRESPKSDEKLEIETENASPEIKIKKQETADKVMLQPTKPFSSWVCPVCTLENPSWKFICEACNKWRPYSVNKLDAIKIPLATTKENTKFEFRLTINPDKSTPAKEKEEIKKISENIRKQVYDILTSGENVRNNLAKLKLTADELKKKPEENSLKNEMKDNKDLTNVHIKRAQAPTYSKRCKNNLNKCDNSSFLKPECQNDGEKKGKFYNENDRENLKKLLNELKDSRTENGWIDNNDERRISKPASNEEDIVTTCDRLNNRDEVIVPQDERDSDFNTENHSYIQFGQDENDKISIKGKNFNKKSSEISHLLLDQQGESRLQGNIQNSNLSFPIITSVDAVDSNNSSNSTLSLDIKSNIDARLKLDRITSNSNFNSNRILNTSVSSRRGKNDSVTDLLINRLLRKLQAAIANGQHHEAANIARELARLKVSCSMMRQRAGSLQSKPVSQNFKINLHTKEDVIHQAYFSLKYYAALPFFELKKKISKEYDIPVLRQRWLYRGVLLSNASCTLEQMGVAATDTLDVFMEPHIDLFLNIGTTLNNSKQVLKENEEPREIISSFENYAIQKTNQPKKEIVLLKLDAQYRTDNDEFSKVVFPQNEEICSGPKTTTVTNNSSQNEWECPSCTLINSIQDRNCVACEFTNKASRSSESSTNVESLKLTNYQELVDMERADFIPYTQGFECTVCLMEYQPGEGIVLKECLHTFCKECITQTVQHSLEAEVKCPFRDNEYSCECILQEREIKALVSPEIYEQHLTRSVKEAENKIQNTFHCKTVNCQGWCIYEDNVNEFHCPVCDKTNCLTCQVIHSGLNCKQYQEIINKESETNADANRTRLMLQEMLQKGEAMTCPTCEIIVMKKWGCDWLRCSMCKTEICWITRGPRWGPNGKGDTSAGCRCGVKGIKCHPRCTYCH